MLNTKRMKCGECGYKYPANPHVDKYEVGREIVYLATRAIDEPWYCKEHRSSQ